MLCMDIDFQHLSFSMNCGAKEDMKKRNLFLDRKCFKSHQRRIGAAGEVLCLVAASAFLRQQVSRHQKGKWSDDLRSLK